MPSQQYTIRRSPTAPKLEAFNHDPAWASASTIPVANFHARSSDHHPAVQAVMLHDDLNLYLFFTVHDRFVRSVQTDYNAMVCTDSCVECFLQPTPRGYFNFEINAGGTLLCYYIRDHKRIPGGFVDFERLPPTALQNVRIAHSLPSVIDPEITTPTTWHIAAQIPTAIFTPYTGPLGPLPGQRWRGNFYKCADKTSHPHWASWNPVGENLNFHSPEHFGDILFGS